MDSGNPSFFLWRTLAVQLHDDFFEYIRLYRPVLRHAGTEMMGQVLRGTLLGIGSFAVFDMFDDQALLPRSVLIASGTFSFLGLLSYRLMIRWVLRVHLVEGRNNAKQNVVIYGAGLAGLQLLASLRQNSMYQVVAFLDDDLNLQEGRSGEFGYTRPIKSQHYVKIIIFRGFSLPFPRKVMPEEKKSWKH